MKIKSLQVKIFVLVVTLFSLVFVLNLYSVISAAGKQAESLIEARLKVGKNVLVDELQMVQTNFNSNVSTIAKDWGFRQAVGQKVDQASLINIMQNHMQRIEADIAFIVDLRGKTIASTFEVTPEFNQMSLASAFGSRANVNTPASLVFFGNVPYFIASEPIEAPIEIGRIFVGKQLSPQLFERMEALINLDITLIRNTDNGSRVILSTAPELGEGNSLERFAEVTFTQHNSYEGKIEWHDQTFITKSFALDTNGQNSVTDQSVIVLHYSFSEAMSIFDRFWLDIVPFFIGGVLLSLVGALAIARGITQPVKRLLNAVKFVAGGQYSRPFELVQSGELGELAKEFKTMQLAVMERENEIIQQAKALQESDRIKYQAEIANREREAAQDATKAKSQFLASMSHEIRTPLTSIIGFSEALQNLDITKNEHESAVLTINHCGNHLLSVINDILDVSKIEAGKIELEYISTPLFPVLNEINKLVEIHAKKKAIEFHLEYQFPLPMEFLTDPTRLKQILINLINNAIKFTEVGTVTLRVSFSENVNTLVFSVEDTGIGMTSDQLNRLFRAFNQADSSTTRKHGGTGLGLYICRQLSELMDGEITVESKVNNGSQFKFLLPIEPIEKNPLVYDRIHADGLSASGVNTSTTPSLFGSVLYADDNADNRRLVSYLVRQTGANIVTVENGEQAVGEALGNEFDLVLMDMQMPEMDGIEATQLLIDTGFSQPIIMMTANVDKGSIERSQKSGATGHFGKPIDTPKFYDLLSKHLSSGPSSTKSINDLDDFESLVIEFKKELPRKIEQLQLAYQEHNWSIIQDITHQIKGSAGSYGYENITTIAVTLEKAIQSGNGQHIEQQLNMIIDQVNQIIAGDE